MYNYAEVTVRRATMSEVDIIKDIINEAYAPLKKQLGSTPIALKEGLDKISRHIQMGNVYVALLGDQVVGTMRASLRGKTGVIARVAVRSKFRGRRIGTVLVDYAENMLQHMGATCIEIDVYGIIENQLNFYIKHGYVKVGTGESEGEPIVIMRKELCAAEEPEDEFS
ncbi:MAG: GNAT family N-acetyltransferase [Candidatus Thorarchaeota archaeon]|nr:GNAT family N-acetyltransferase [Candidatus Thorarchaeota archaeon]